MVEFFAIVIGVMFLLGIVVPGWMNRNSSCGHGRITPDNVSDRLAIWWVFLFMAAAFGLPIYLLITVGLPG